MSRAGTCSGHVEVPTVADGPGLLALIKEDWEVNLRDWTRPGFRALVVYRFGVWRYGIRPRPLRIPFSRLYWVLHRWVRNHYGIEIHATSTIGRRLFLAHQHGIVFHEHVTIGDDCIIRHGVTMGAAAQYSPDDAPTLGDRVNVGAGAAILGRVTIGDGARIAPNAVVTIDVPAGATAIGAPARIVRTAKPEPVEDAP